MKLPKVFLNLAELFSAHGYQLYIVGGTSRDMLLEKELFDFDFATDATVSEMKKFLNIKSTFENVGSVNLEYDTCKVDITTLRKEGKYEDFRHPSEVIYVKDTLSDSIRRDFTINALYIDKEGNIYDYYNGRKDLENHLIRMIGNPEDRIKEDPLRILRAIRFSLILGFSLDEALESAIRKNGTLLKKLNYSKCLNEIKKMNDFNKEKAQELLKYYDIGKYIPIDYGFDKIPVIDMHCDTLTRDSVRDNGLYDNDLHINLLKLASSHYMLQCFAVFIYYKYDKAGTPMERTNRYIDIFEREMKENANIVTHVTNYKEVMNAFSNHKIAALLTLEEGEIIEGKLENLEALYKRGVRMMSLTWNFPNSIGWPNLREDIDEASDLKRVENENGLTPFGFEVVRKMNELGMIVDISHLSDKGAWDVLKTTSYPIVASHSDARSVHNCGRNLPDDLIKAIARNHGMIGINYCNEFVSDSKENQIPDLVKHIKHIVSVGGISSVGLGSDFDGIATPNGLSDSSKLYLLQKELEKENFSREDIEKIFYKNFLRVLKRVCK